MILNTDKPNVIHSGTPVRRIDMSEMDAESIAVMLVNSRDGFYSNKELAPIREYSTNARDSHVQSGIPTRQIEVTLPTQMEPELKIRDFGNGLSMEQMTDVYFKYWKSTKRNTNDQNGCLGIGAKSAFAYAPVYTVTSWCEGMKTVATGQKNGFADIIFHEPNTLNEERGVEITIPIQSKDIEKFITEALNFYKYWDIRPVFKNVDDDRLKAAFASADSTPFLFGDGWAVRPAGYGHGETKAVMGFVPYDIDWRQVQNSIAPELYQKISGVFQFLQENLTTLSFNNGTLAFTPNRESLQYNDITIAALSEKLSVIYDCLLNLITSKISDASSIWDAKIRYNQIFRKELDGFDKASVYGGNLQTLESLVRNRIQWNGLTIKNGMFEGLEDWCANEGNVAGSYRDDSNEDILTTFVKDASKTNVTTVKNGYGRRRRYRGDCKIICSPKSIVVIQDTDKAFLAKGFARWILFQSGLDVSQVYVLNLAKADVKDEFYKEFNFETVPVKLVSENETLIKAYLKTVRAVRSSGEPRASRPLNCPFMEIKNRRLATGTYLSGTYWGAEDVNARNLDGGGYYVVYTKTSFFYNGSEINHDNAQYFWQSVYDLALIAGVDLPKVYGIHPKTAESVWFKEAVEEGDWTNLEDFINKHADALPKDIITKIDAFIRADDNRIGTIAAKDIAPMLNGDSGIGKHFNEIVEFIAHWDIKDVASWLRLSGFDADETEVTRFKTMNSEIRKKYPLLFRMSEMDDVYNCESKESVHNLEFPLVREMAEYINLVDAKV